jgi:plasmid maintenance system antidote protein VapI
MKAKHEQLTMTELLRQALTEADSINGVAVKADVQKTSLIRFLRGEQSLRLDMADRLAKHFGIVSTRKAR